MKNSMVIVAAVATALAGCSATTPRADARFGAASAAIRTQQTADPGAARSTDTAAGIDGQSARAALNNYRESLRARTAESPALPGTASGIAGQ
jgi:hypothetical protein